MEQIKQMKLGKILRCDPIHHKESRKIMTDKLVLHLLRCNRIKIKSGWLVRRENSSIKESGT
jgi:hypothetical protein